MQVQALNQEPEETRHNAILEEDDDSFAADLKQNKCKKTLGNGFFRKSLSNPRTLLTPHKTI